MKGDTEAMADESTGLAGFFEFDMVCGHPPGTMLRNVLEFIADPEPTLAALNRLAGSGVGGVNE